MHNSGLVLSAALVAFLCLQSTAHTQVAFEVASIKPNDDPSIGSGATFRLLPDGGISAQHFPARSLITIAFSLQQWQLIHAPGWAQTAYYDVQARPAQKMAREDTFRMLQTLLVERFGLRFHREQRSLGGFALVRARPGTLGPSLRPSSLDCTAAAADQRCREGGITSTSFAINGGEMWNLLQVLISHVGAPIEDATGLDGRYDMELRWSEDPAPSNDLPTITTAIEEQLGLKLEPRRVNAEVFVVDRLEQPTPD